MPFSAYLSRNIVPTLNDFQHEGAIFVWKSSLRFSQRVVSKVGFYGRGRIRMDDFLIESSIRRRDSPPTFHLSVCIGKARTFIRICDERALNCHEHKLFNCRLCPLDRMQNEFCFVQYYEVVVRESLDVDEIDKQMNYLRITWEWEEQTYTLSAGNYCGLIYVDALQGCAHILGKDNPINALDINVDCRSTLRRSVMVFRRGAVICSPWTDYIVAMNTTEILLMRYSSDSWSMVINVR